MKMNSTTAEELLRKKIRQRKEEVEALERELELLVNAREGSICDNQSRTKAGSLFYVRIITDDVPEVIDPRDTIGAHLFGRKWSDFCFWALYRNKSMGRIIYLICALCPMLLWLLSLTVEPRFGWGVGLSIPFSLFSFSGFNRKLLNRVLASFEWWAVFVLLCISVGTMIDAFAVDPPRTFGSCCFLLGFSIASMSDARPLFRKAVKTLKFVYLTWACLFWTALILWWLNKWILIRETVIPLGNVITLNVQSIGFSCFSSVAVLFTRYAWIALRYQTGGTMVMIKARVQYLPSKLTAPTSSVENKIVSSVTQSDN